MRRFLLLVGLLLVFSGKAYAQTEIQSGPVNPNHCNPNKGQLFFNNSTMPGIYYYCSDVNTWTPSGGIQNVSVAPVGACTAGSPPQQVTSTGLIYTCQGGTWGTASGGSPSNPNNTLQKNNGGTFGASGLTDDGTSLTVDRDQHPKGPNPYVDITRYGARAVNTAYTLPTATCTPASTSVTLSSASIFQNSDYVVLFGCGPASTLATPAAPSVTSGSLETYTVPDSVVAPITGASSYTYAVVSVDSAGGLSAASTATTIATGVATLGRKSVSVTSATLTGQTLTITTSSAHGMAVNTLFHFSGSTSALMSGYWTATTGTTGSTIVATIGPYSASTTQNSTGGTVVYFNGNKISWTNPANSWSTIICGQRPGDASMHVIGKGQPVSTNNDASANFTDYGTTLTTAPQLQPYISDAVCTQVAPTNQYLSTQITNGGGSTSIVVADAATNSNVGQISRAMAIDIGPALIAAANAGQATSVLIPGAGASNAFFLNSMVNPVKADLNVIGTLNLNETLSYPNSPGCPTLTGTFIIKTAMPGIYCKFGGELKQASFSDGGQNGTAAIIIDAAFAFKVSDTAFSVTGHSDMGMVVLPQPHSFQVSETSVTGSNFGVDQTWTPAFYFNGGTNTGLALGNVTWKGGRENVARGFYIYGHCAQFWNFEDVYINPPNMPLWGVQSNLNTNINLKITTPIIDTATTPYVTANPVGTNTVIVALVLIQPGPLSAEAGGVPEAITGSMTYGSYTPINVSMNQLAFYSPVTSILSGNTTTANNVVVRNSIKTGQITNPAVAPVVTLVTSGCGGFFAPAQATNYKVVFYDALGAFQATDSTLPTPVSNTVTPDGTTQCNQIAMPTPPLGAVYWFPFFGTQGFHTNVDVAVIGYTGCNALIPVTITTAIDNKASTCARNTPSSNTSAINILSNSLLGLGNRFATTMSGNSGTIGQTSGTLTNGNLTKFDANGNIVDSTLSAATIATAPLMVYNTASAATNTNISATNMVASTSALHGYMFGWTVSLTTVGSGCSGSTTVEVDAVFTDPNAAGTTTQNLGVITIATTGNGTVGFVASGVDFITAKSSTAVQYQTSNYTAGSGCTINPTYQITPTLVQQW